MSEGLGLYEQAVKFGLQHRSYIPSVEEARANVNAVLAGEPFQREEPEIDWIRSLPSISCTKIEREAYCALDCIVHEIRALRREFREEPASKTSSSWLARLRLVLHWRDDLESVVTLLAAVRNSSMSPQGPGLRLRAVLSAFDEEAALIMDEILPIHQLMGDERLMKVAHDVPDAWWMRGIVDPWSWHPRF